MKNSFKILSAALACFLLAACSAQSDEKTPKPVNTQPATNKTESANTETTPLSASGVLPLISINSVEQDNMDFVTKPVNKFVSASIASWTPKYVMPPEPYYEKCSVTVTDTNNKTLLGNVSANVKVRGNWTSNYEKKPLRIKFDEKQEMLGLNDGAKLKNWVLMAEYKDLSMLRNKTALDISREILAPDGLYSADSQLVEVEINGRYWGVYLLTEQQQISAHRVNITEADESYTGTDIGYFLEFDGYFKNEEPLQQFHVGYADNAPLIPFDGNNGSGMEMSCLPKNKKDPKQDVGITIKNDIYSQEQHDFIATFVDNVYNIMYAAAYENKALVFDESYSLLSESTAISPQEAVEQVVDVQSLADMYIISELTCDADIYWSSFYMSADFGETGSKKLRFEAPWDFDSAMGNKNRCLDGTGFYAANIVPDVNGGTDYGGSYETINPWLAVLMYQDWFQEIIREKWTSVYDDGTFERAIKSIENDKTQLSKAFECNYKRWDNMDDRSDFEAELSKTVRACKNHEQMADQLADWLTKRVDFLNDYWHK